MIEEAKAKGLTSEKIMWESVDELDELLCHLKKEHPKEYWAFVRKQHGLMYNNHYTEEFAKWDIEQMKPFGMYWSKQQVEDATRGLAFPPGTTPCDKWVAYNATKNDLSEVLKDEDILKVSYAFWFNDKDWRGKNKVWEYMGLNHSL